MESKPIIGILLDYDTKATSAGGYSDLPWYALRTEYARAISQNGGVPLHIPYEYGTIHDYIKICKGIVIPGGDYDIPSSYYKESLHPKSIIANNNERIDFEFKLLEFVLKHKIPFLGICAGHQALNVVLGGSLHQDINSIIDTEVNHKAKHSMHEITLNENSLLYKTIKEKNFLVNSFHHQAINKIGRDLLISSHASDGIIESIEHIDHPFCLGVEWHPEYQRTPQDKILMKAFIDAARKYKFGI